MYNARGVHPYFDEIDHKNRCYLKVWINLFEVSFVFNEI